MSDQLSSYTGQSCDWYDVPCHASSFASWLFNALLWIPRKIFEWITDGLASVAGSIDLPIQTGALSGLAGGVSWFADLTAAPEGFAMVLAALLARFALKLIPFFNF